ncbi:MAG: hypothetical protein HN509_05815, partial [Halobacteriovoraceae bacterium]|nr:hypothetical protein [Halobacteriovoraceae bacterium]
VSDITEVNPSDRYFYQNLLREKILLKGVKVIVSNKECALTFHGRKKAEDRKLLSKGITLPTKSFYQINSAVCEDCRECVESTGCPGLTQVFDAYGSKLAIDPQICVGDSYCTKLKVCPSFERVEVSNFHPTKYQKKKDIEDLVSLPEPVLTHSFESILSGNDLRVVVTGVGGSGVTTISRILAKAAVEMDGRTDLDFKFVDQKGLAQRNGNVTAHLAIYKKGKSYGAVTPKGTASLLLSPDILDAALQLDFLAIDGLGIFDRSFQIPLSILLDKGEEKEPLRENELETELVKKLGEKVVFGSFKDIAHHHLGRSVYASAMILGAAYQSGRLPFSLDSLKNAFETTMRGDEIETNWRAFRLGRELFHNPQKELVGEKTQSENTGLYLKSLKESYLFSGSSRKGISSFNLAFEKLNQIFKSSRSEHLAQILHDILVYDRGRLLGNFLEEAEKISTLYAKQEWQELALGILARTYFIKDEIMVSHLMISPLHEKTNLETYSGLGTAYKVCPINRPSFDIFGIKLEFNISPNRWMLKCMRHFRILRRLLPSWHKIEREIAISIREEIVKGPQYENFTQERSRLMKLCNIKGYREVRFKNAENALL